MRRRYKPPTNTSYEFELDLAPLLAVMVKLVPVLLISSAFVQIMNVETDLPQAVQQAINKQDDPKNELASLQLDINNKTGFRLIIEQKGEQKVESIPLTADGQFDLGNLHQLLVRTKTNYPDVFRLELNPDSSVSYKDIVKVMDEARRARDNQIKFPLIDSKTNQQTETNYMFPDVVFVNIMEG